jgi:hypothetical protein
MTHSQLLEGLKCESQTENNESDALQLLARLKNESKYKTVEGGGIGACSLAHNTLRGRGACWSSGMGLGRVDKLHSLTHACTQPTQGG